MFMRIVDIFASRQGEGKWTGVQSSFVRVGGCNLRCSFCDTPYASWLNQEGEDLSVEEVVGRIVLLGHNDVVLTGGEPMLYAEMIPLTRMLHERGYRITIETAGTLELPVFCDLMSISPKLSNSTPLEALEKIRTRHETNRNRPEVVRKLVLAYPYQVKFVVDSVDDFPEIERYLDVMPEIQPEYVWMMPQAVDCVTMFEKATFLIPYCQRNHFNYCPRKQIEWFGNFRRT